MIRTDVTYGQLDKVLRGLGFSCKVVTKDPPTRFYEHKESGAWFTVPLFPESDRVWEAHLVTARVMVDGFGIADAKVFDAKLQKAG